MKTNTQDGYTLLELLTVLTIVSILSSIAIPHYRDYTRRAYDERARSDLLAAVVAEEAYFLDYERYLTCDTSSCTNLPGLRATSPCVELQITATATGFHARAECDKGTRAFQWDSESGTLR